EQFVTDLLLDKLGVKHLIIGDDFHFGFKRQGNYQLLTRMAEEHNFHLENTCTLTLGEERVSSTAVREALTSGDLIKAEVLLGRVFSMSGRVFHGDKRGRQIGFPTANLLLHRNVLPLNGVFAVNLILNEGKSNTTEHQGIANIGRRPTVDGIREQLEVHLFDFDADIYGKAVTVEFLQFVRSEQKFSGIEQLKAQIEKDVASVKHFFNLNKRLLKQE
ncbi:MAG: riboflavin biosynthesis protein RibF, partial [Gammaproteobacteria bacterium]|nr:riboflavin biosynthesis protein RibF [Gammaproteobacteria bacterium]